MHASSPTLPQVYLAYFVTENGRFLTQKNNWVWSQAIGTCGMPWTHFLLTKRRPFSTYLSNRFKRYCCVSSLKCSPQTSRIHVLTYGIHLSSSESQYTMPHLKHPPQPLHSISWSVGRSSLFQTKVDS